MTLYILTHTSFVVTRDVFKTFSNEPVVSKLDVNRAVLKGEKQRDGLRRIHFENNNVARLNPTVKAPRVIQNGRALMLRENPVSPQADTKIIKVEKDEFF